jgi:RNA polymerase sigma factor (sigma-70 family)
MVDSSDETLLAGLAAGDHEAAAAFVRRFQRRAYGLARTILGDPNAAEDAAQEAFVRAWRYAGSYDARRGKVTSWFLTIVRNVAVDRARLKGAETPDPELLTSRLELDARQAADAYAPIDERAHLRDALAILPREQRRAVVLAAYFGRTAREVAELEGVPLGTAKTRIRTGMLALRERLEVGDGRG